MKIYEDRYEKVFTEQKSFIRRCNINKVSPYNNVPLNTTLYVNQFKKEMRSFEHDTFDHLVKITWLSRRFCYGGERRKRHGCNGTAMDSAYGLFIRHYVGYEIKFMFNSSFDKIFTYMDDLFVNFDEGNPFEEEYKYPYEHVTLSHMVLVYQMRKERMELLEYAEKNKISYVKFLDFIINWTNCYNEELGKHKYEFKFSNKYVWYVKKMF